MNYTLEVILEPNSDELGTCEIRIYTDTLNKAEILATTAKKLAEMWQCAEYLYIGNVITLHTEFGDYTYKITHVTDSHGGKPMWKF